MRLRDRLRHLLRRERKPSGPIVSVASMDAMLREYYSNDRVREIAGLSAWLPVADGTARPVPREQVQMQHDAVDAEMRSLSERMSRTHFGVNRTAIARRFIPRPPSRWRRIRYTLTWPLRRFRAWLHRDCGDC